MFIILVLASAIIATNAQDVVLKKVQRGDKVAVYAENKSDFTQLVTLDMILVYVIPSQKFPFETLMKAGEIKELVVLSPVPLRAWSYTTQYSYEKVAPTSGNEMGAITSPQIPNNAPRIGNTPSQSDSTINTNQGLPVNNTDDAAPHVDYFIRPPDNTDDAPMPAAYAPHVKHNHSIAKH